MHIAAGPAPQVRDQLEHEAVDGQRVDVGGFDVDVELEPVGERDDGRRRPLSETPLPLASSNENTSGQLPPCAGSPAPLSPVQQSVMAQPAGRTPTGPKSAGVDDGAGLLGGRDHVRLGFAGGAAAVAGDADDVRVEEPARARSRRARLGAPFVPAP